MRGVHDLGGVEGFGEVEVETDEPVFHERWEAVVFAMMRAAGGAGAVPNADRFRHAIERIDPVAYLTHGYYGRWLGGLETLLIEAGVLTREEIDQAFASRGGRDSMLVGSRPQLPPDPVGPAPAGAGAARRLPSAPAFRVGDTVRSANATFSGHTRLPEYVRGKTGTVVDWHDGWVFPDSNAHGNGEAPQHLYTVEFSAIELWGGPADPNQACRIDLFESYLEAP